MIEKAYSTNCHLCLNRRHWHTVATIRVRVVIVVVVVVVVVITITQPTSTTEKENNLGRVENNSPVYIELLKTKTTSAKFCSSRKS